MAEGNKEIRKEKRGPFEIAAWVFLGVGVVLIAFLMWRVWPYYGINGKPDLGATGQIGDFIGGVVGSLWALAGVLLFYQALVMQKRELRLQREEIKMQREEMAMQREVMDLQRKEMAQQGEELKLQREESVENRIMNLAHYQTNIFEAEILKLKDTLRDINDRDRIAYFLRKFRNSIDSFEIERELDFSIREYLPSFRRYLLILIKIKSTLKYQLIKPELHKKAFGIVILATPMDYSQYVLQAYNKVLNKNLSESIEELKFLKNVLYIDTLKELAVTIRQVYDK